MTIFLKKKKKKKERIVTFLIQFKLFTRFFSKMFCSLLHIVTHFRVKLKLLLFTNSSFIFIAFNLMIEMIV